MWCTCLSSSLLSVSYFDWYLLSLVSYLAKYENISEHCNIFHAY